MPVVVVPGPRLLLRMVYDCRRFHEATMTRTLQKLHRLLMAMATGSEMRLASFSPPTEVERRQLINSFNQSLD